MKFFNECLKSRFFAAFCGCFCFLMVLVGLYFLNDQPLRPKNLDDRVAALIPASDNHGKNHEFSAKVYNPPIQFEERRDSSGKCVGYIAKNSHQTFYMTEAGVFFVFPEDQEVKKCEKRSCKEAKIPPNAIMLTFIGRGEECCLKGDDLLSCKSHYFRGNDPSKWEQNISNFGTVTYKEIYPGIDTLFYGNGPQIEYDLYIKPGANPDSIQLCFEGADKIYLDQTGNLHISLHDKNEFWMQRPVLYQGDGSSKKIIEGEFKITSNATHGTLVGFSVGKYDSTKPLIIDPLLVFSTYLGGSDKSHGNAIGVDAQGNVYVTGDISASDFPITPNAFQRSLSSTSIYVTKFNKEGTTLLYSTYIGGTNGDKSSALAVDKEGNVFVTGFTSSADFPVTKGAFAPKCPVQDGVGTAFVTKIAPDGSSLIYSSYLGGSASDNGGGIAIDDDGNAYVVGTTYSVDFPVTPGAYQTNNRSIEGGNAFVSKVNKDGSALIYSTYIGGSGSIANEMIIGDVGEAIALDKEGFAYITGITYSQDFPVTKQAYQKQSRASMGKSNAYVAKLSPVGNELVYSTYLGGNNIYEGNEKGNGIAVDSEGKAIVVGRTCSDNFPVTKNAFQKTRSSLNKVETGFVSILDPSGSSLLYSTYLGGRGSSGLREQSDTTGDGCICVALDKVGKICIGGYTYSSDFPITDNAFEKRAPLSKQNGKSKKNGFLSQLSANGSLLLYSSFIGGNGNGHDSVEGITVSDVDKVYITGETESAEFPTSEKAFQKEVPGKIRSNSFVMEFKLS